MLWWNLILLFSGFLSHIFLRVQTFTSTKFLVKECFTAFTKPLEIFDKYQNTILLQWDVQNSGSRTSKIGGRFVSEIVHTQRSYLLRRELKTDDYVPQLCLKVFKEQYNIAEQGVR
jgi:hypothetical protein